MRYSSAAPQKFHREVMRAMWKKHRVTVELVANNNKHPKWRVGELVLSACCSPRDEDDFVRLSVKNLEKALGLR